MNDATVKALRKLKTTGGGDYIWQPSVTAGTPDTILNRPVIRPTLTPHYFRHNYVTMLYEAGVDPLIAMKIVGHTDYQTTANIYTHIKEEMLKKATVDLEGVFKKRAGKE